MVVAIYAVAAPAAAALPTASRAYTYTHTHTAQHSHYFRVIFHSTGFPATAYTNTHILFPIFHFLGGAPHLAAFPRTPHTHTKSRLSTFLPFPRTLGLPSYRSKCVHGATIFLLFVHYKQKLNLKKKHYDIPVQFESSFCKLYARIIQNGTRRRSFNRWVLSS